MINEKVFPYGGYNCSYNLLPNISTSFANVIVQWYGREREEREYKEKKARRERGKRQRKPKDYRMSIKCLLPFKLTN